jgi:hypothetical protein
MSGDMDTALGNCVLMLGMALSILRGIGKFDFVCDGDDGIVIIESDLATLAQAKLLRGYKDFGHILKIEKFEMLQQVEFCKSYPLRIQGRWRMVRKPDKIFAGLASSSTHHLDGPTMSVLRLASYCEMTLNAGVPVIYPLVERFNRALGEGRTANARALVALTNRFRLERTAKSCDITEEARLDFSLATGIPPEEQRKLEEMDLGLSLESKPTWITHLDGWSQGLPLARVTKPTWC